MTSPQIIYLNNILLLTTPILNISTNPIFNNLSSEELYTFFGEKGQKYCLHGNWKLDLNWLPRRINQTQGIEQKALTPISGSSYLVIPPSLFFSGSPNKELSPISLQPTFKLQLLIFSFITPQIFFFLYTVNVDSTFAQSLSNYFFIFAHVSFT